MKRILLLISLICGDLFYSSAQDSLMFRRISDEIMLRGKCYEDLRILCKKVGHRLSGSPQAEKAVDWGMKTLKEAGADTVWLQPVNVPVWVRGKETLSFRFTGSPAFTAVPMLSLGNTAGTEGKILEAEVVMVNDFDAFRALSDQAVNGKIIFFNHRFPQEIINTFEGYGEAGPYRWFSPNIASARGAAGVIIRSVSTGTDDVPHTGSMRYADTVKQIPAVAVGNKTADVLEAQCSKGKVIARLQSHCKMKGTALSYNIVAELRGTEYPEQIVLTGGHLDSWDVGEGAHDDGAGCVQSIEVLRTFRSLGIRPSRTLRVVLFMNEENGLKGGIAYSDSAKARGEHHILAIESDAGGFSPRGFGLIMDSSRKEKISSYGKLFLPYGVYDFSHDEGGADISPLNKEGVPLAGLLPDPQRYFDVHHTNSDTFEAVNHRELKLGATVITQLVYLATRYGL